MKSVLVVAATLAAAESVVASDEAVWLIASPILSGAEGVSIVDTPQLVWGDEWATPGCRVSRTTDDVFLKTDLGLENRNVAARMGIRVHVARPSPSSSPAKELGLFGDTLRVVLDVSSLARELPYPLGGPPEYALEATLSCMIINAGRDPHQPQFLDVLVEGRPGFEPLTGLYRLQPVPDVATWRVPIWQSRKVGSQ